MTVYYLHAPTYSSMMIGSSSEFDTHDDHHKVRSDHRCSSNAKLIPSHLHSTTPTPSGFRSDERNGRSDSDFRFHWSDSDKDKTGETRIPGKKRKKGELVSRLGDEAHEVNLPYLSSITPKKKIFENLQVESTCQKKRKSP
ncbi:uncharacterized protein Bfra_004545 [Botrytis fragariae]|uniref:Uncharacterized protein n=1 Tax=Botrytis fragariae TaxID=1964551 RepID=A0A8H6AVZ8_9HELO|nr:uncharacterized protein Bfra_004545 [Botrytis fragariae]KAF5874534.1 hypothetical protein Bfra_004545 [Botrytis fragariae]